MKRRGSNENGYVMVFTIVLMVMLCLGVLVFYDLQNAISRKVKFQAAADSAALTGAMWQKEALNAIGELNLIKVTNAVLQLDPDPVAANRLIAQTQTRISFVYPMMGVSAAQQAAKINGAETNVAVRQLMQYHLQRLESSVYDQSAQTVNGYSWRQDYEDMLNTIINQGPSVRMSTRLGAATNMNPSWLGSERFFWAILSGNFCNGTIRSMFQYDAIPESYWNTKWWQNVDMGKMDFPEESEYLTLGVRFSAVSGNNLALAELKNAVSRHGWTYDADFSTGPFCCYDGSWNQTPNANWKNNNMLRGEVKKSAWHGGAISVAQVENIISRTMNYKMSGKIKKYERQNVNAKKADSSYRPKAIAAAKAFGELSTGNTPCSIPIILPVFKDVALVPSSMYPSDLSNNQSIYFELFLIWLSENAANIDDIGADSVADSLPSPTGYYIDYLHALQAISSDALDYKITETIDGKTVTTDVTLRDYIRNWYENNQCITSPRINPDGPSL